MDAFASSPLPALLPCDGEHLAMQIRNLDANLPKRNIDVIAARLQLREIYKAARTFPREAVDAFCAQAIRIKPGETKAWFPDVGDWIKFFEGWQRPGKLEHARAVRMVRDERQSRMNDVMRSLGLGHLDGNAIAALPERWKEIAETRGLLRRDSDGGYHARPLFALSAASAAEEAA